MKPIDPNDTNDRLGRVLQQWKVDAALPPRFQDDVWRRIKLGEARGVFSWWRDWVQLLEAAFRRPALAISYVAVLVLAGLSIGFAQARLASAHTDAALGARYVQSVDPYQARH